MDRTKHAIVPRGSLAPPNNAPTPHFNIDAPSANMPGPDFHADQRGHPPSRQANQEHTRANPPLAAGGAARLLAYCPAPAQERTVRG